MAPPNPLKGTFTAVVNSSEKQLQAGKRDMVSNLHDEQVLFKGI
jgi:hypothetical protein